MHAKRKGETIREAVGIFQTAANFKDAVQALEAVGFGHDELGLLASEHSVRASLDDLYEMTVDRDQTATAGAPVTAFVRRESVGDTPRSLGGSLFFVGASGALGGIVTSTVVLGGALLAAIGGALAAGTIGVLVGAIIHQSDAEFLEEQIGKGHLLLFVRLKREEDEENALRILDEHSFIDPKIITVKADTAET